MEALRVEGGLLHEPTRKAMLQRVEETLLAQVEVRFSTLNGKTLFRETGRNAGLEVQGDTQRLVVME
jgi:hypothetical protein